MSTWVGTGPVGLPSLLGGLRRPVRRRRVARRVAPGRAVPGARAGARTPLRLTRRGRLAVAGLLLAVAASSVVLGRLSLASAVGTPVAPATDTLAGSTAAAGGSTTAATARGTGRRSSGSQLAELAAAGRVQVPAGWSVVTAAPGDSLWSVARRVQPDAEPREVIERIVERNGLVGTDIAAGDALLVPAS